MTTSQRGSYGYYRALEEDQVNFVVTNCNRPTPLPQVMNKVNPKDTSKGWLSNLITKRETQRTEKRKVDRRQI